MATDDETFTTCSVCSATTDLKKDNFGWDYCACIDANYCPECSPTNACECGQDGSCECANCATDDDINKLKMATYNDLPTVVTENIFTYLRHERRQPPHAYCIDKLIEYTNDLIDPYIGLTDEGEHLYDDLSLEPAREFFGDFVGEAVMTSFFCPYVEDMGYDEKLPEDKVRLVENPKKFMKDYVETVLTKKSEDKDIVNDSKKDINPIIKRQLMSLKNTLKNNNLTLSDIKDFIEGNE